MMSFPFSSAASFLLRLVIGAKYAYGVAVNEFALSPCKQFLCLEMKFVSELLANKLNTYKKIISCSIPI